LISIARLDTHQHCMPRFYAEWLQSHGIFSVGGRELPDWSPTAAESFMDNNGISGAILSISTPGVHLGSNQEARDMARRINDYLAGVAQRQPRLGFFAVLPLPDVEGALEEAAYALDTLRADGVLILANTRGLYFGEPAWEPLMTELNTRQAVVFVHPSELAGGAHPDIPPSSADFLLDTTRAAIRYARSGSLERHPDVRVVLSHAGGFVPYAAERMAAACSPDGSNAGGLARLRRFYFDTALSGTPYTMPSLLAFADLQRITFGSDWPFANEERASHFIRRLDEVALEPSLRKAIYRDNATLLFPRFGAIA